MIKKKLSIVIILSLFVLSVPCFLKADENLPKSFVFTEWGQRNPFDTTGQDISGKDSASVNKDYLLQGVFLGTDKPSTIINDTVLRVGETVKGLTVKEIKETGVILVNDAGKETSLIMPSQ